MNDDFSADIEGGCRLSNLLHVTSFTGQKTDGVFELVGHCRQNGVFLFCHNTFKYTTWGDIIKTFAIYMYLPHTYLEEIVIDN